MKRCKTCGWWFEPKTNRSMYCDDECRKEADRISKREWWRKNRGARKPSILKVDASKLPPPYIAANKRIQGGDGERQRFTETVRDDGKEASV